MRHGAVVVAGVSVALSAAWGCEQMLGFDELKPTTAEGGGGGAAGASSGTSSGTSAGTGTASGTSTGTESGTGTGTESGTGTGSGTQDWHCPAMADRCTEGAALEESCGECGTAVCQSDANCCMTDWDAECVRLAVQACYNAVCEDHVCEVLFEATYAEFCQASGAECDFRINTGTCHDACVARGTFCQWAQPCGDCDTSCSSPAASSEFCDDPASSGEGGFMKCACNLHCGDDAPCPLGATCSGGSSDPHCVQ